MTGAEFQSTYVRVLYFSSLFVDSPCLWIHATLFECFCILHLVISLQRLLPVRVGSYPVRWFGDTSGLISLHWSCSCTCLSNDFVNFSAYYVFALLAGFIRTFLSWCWYLTSPGLLLLFDFFLLPSQRLKYQPSVLSARCGVCRGLTGWRWLCWTLSTVPGMYLRLHECLHSPATSYMVTSDPPGPSRKICPAMLQSEIWSLHAQI